MVKTKRCSKCKEYKPINEFYKCTKSKDGHNSQCIECLKEYRETLCTCPNCGLDKTRNFFTRHVAKCIFRTHYLAAGYTCAGQIIDLCVREGLEGQPEWIKNGMKYYK
jgi:hypothetical protein